MRRSLGRDADGFFFRRAPVSVLNVRPGQPVEVIVSKRMTEDYVPEKRSFGGSGNRLGSPVPVAVGTSSAPPIAPTGGAERAGVTTLFEVDQSQPTTTVQIRLADGTRYLVYSWCGDCADSKVGFRAG